MRALEWHRRLSQYAEFNQKRLFTRAELANIAGSRMSVAHMQVTRLLASGVLRRYAHGLYGLPGLQDPGELVIALDSSAYITSRRGLFLRGVLSQVPAVITAFTRRRLRNHHVDTALGRIVFTRAQKPIYQPPAQGAVAPAEQCLLDWIWVLLREGIEPESQGTLNLSSLNMERLRQLAALYPAPVGRGLDRLCSSRKFGGAHDAQNAVRVLDTMTPFGSAAAGIDSWSCFYRNEAAEKPQAQYLQSHDSPASDRE